MIPSFKVCDKVRIVRYGSIMWSNMQMDFDLPIIFEGDHFIAYDTARYMVGKTGTIREVSVIQGKPQYALSDIEGKVAWYDEEQLECV